MNKNEVNKYILQGDDENNNTRTTTNQPLILLVFNPFDFSTSKLALNLAGYSKDHLTSAPNLLYNS